MQARFDPRAFRFFQLDDGYQKSLGDWTTSDRFPHGHAWLTGKIREAGFEPALWLAPFAASENAPVAGLGPLRDPYTIAAATPATTSSATAAPMNQRRRRRGFG